MRDDSPWDWEGFRLKNIRIRQTVSRKIKKNRAYTILYRLGLRVVNKERGLEEEEGRMISQEGERGPKGDKTWTGGQKRRRGEQILSVYHKP